MVKKYRGEILLFLAALMGATGFLSMKYLLNDGFSAFQIIMGRFFVAILCMGVLYFRELKKITKEEWKAGFFIGFLLFLLFSLMTIGLNYTTPSVSAFLVNMQAVVVPFIVWIFQHKRPSLHSFFASGLTVVGVALLSITEELRIDIGAMLSLLASIAFAFQMFFVGEYVQKFEAVRLTIVENITVFVLSFLVVVFLQEPIPTFSAANMGNFISLGIFCTGIYFLLQSYGQKWTTASKTAIIITFESVFAAIMAAVFCGERMIWRGYLGCILLFLAILVAEGVPFQKCKEIAS